jgi:SnoaL-like domain
MQKSVLSVATWFAVALDTEDYEALAELLSPDCEYHAKSSACVGPEAIIASYREL